MANVRLTWTLPTLRKSGRALDPATIQAVEIAISADAGATFTVTDVMPPNILELLFTELEIGTWVFRGVTVDTSGRRSDPATATVDVPDETAPGAPVLTAELAL